MYPASMAAVRQGPCIFYSILSVGYQICTRACTIDPKLDSVNLSTSIVYSDVDRICLGNSERLSAIYFCLLKKGGTISGSCFMATLLIILHKIFCKYLTVYINNYLSYISYEIFEFLIQIILQNAFVENLMFAFSIQRKLVRDFLQALCGAHRVSGKSRAKDDTQNKRRMRVVRVSRSSDFYKGTGLTEAT